MLYYLFDSWLEGAAYAYKSVLFRGTVAILFSFLLVVLTGPKVIRKLVKYKLGDRPEFDHASLNELMRDRTGVPTMGGVLILFAIIASMLLLADLGNYYARLGVFCCLWLGALGAVDDWLKLTVKTRSGTRDGLKTYEKLLFQIALGVLLGYFIYRHGSINHALIGPTGGLREVAPYRILTVPFYKPGIALGTAAFMLVTVLVITSTSNAVNLTDGMDGLAAGCVALCGFVFMALAFISSDQPLAATLLLPHIPRSGELVVLCGAMVGACLGFLWYNCHPAKVFMGDTGSLPLGGLVGFVAIVLRQELMLLIAGGVFVMEAISVIMQVGYFKFTGGKRIFRVAPIHHHFHLGGWSETQVVTRFWLLAAVFSAFALMTIKLR